MERSADRGAARTMLALASSKCLSNALASRGRARAILSVVRSPDRRRVHDCRSQPAIDVLEVRRAAERDSDTQRQIASHGAPSRLSIELRQTAVLHEELRFVAGRHVAAVSLRTALERRFVSVLTVRLEVVEIVTSLSFRAPPPFPRRMLSPWLHRPRHAELRPRAQSCSCHSSSRDTPTRSPLPRATR